MLAYPTNEAMGFYSFNAEAGQGAEIKKIEKYTELKYYGFTIIVIALLTFCLIVGIFRFNELVSLEKKKRDY